MNVNFNIPDTLGEQFISASKWMINRPDLSDDRVVKKNIKNYMGNCIDEYNKHLMLNDSASLVLSLTQQEELVRSQCFIANEEYIRIKRIVESEYVPVDIGPD